MRTAICRSRFAIGNRGGASATAYRDHFLAAQPRAETLMVKCRLTWGPKTGTPVETYGVTVFSSPACECVGSGE
jgi:hypothetical protein